MLCLTNGFSERSPLGDVFTAYRRKLEKVVGVSIPYAPLPQELVEVLEDRPTMRPGMTNEEWVLYWIEKDE